MLNLPIVIGVASALLFVMVSTLFGKYYDHATPLQKLKSNIVWGIVIGILLGVLTALVSKIL